MGTGPFFGGKSRSAQKTSTENMDLSPFAAQGGQSHFRGKNVNSLVTSFPPRKSGQSPVNGYARLSKRRSAGRMAEYVGSSAQAGSVALFGRATLPAIGDRADGGGYRHSLRSLLAAAARAMVGNGHGCFGNGLGFTGDCPDFRGGKDVTRELTFLPRKWDCPPWPCIRRGLSRFLWQDATKMGMSPLPLKLERRPGTVPRLLLDNVALLLAVAATAAGWHHCCWHLRACDDLGCYVGRKAQPVCIEATAVRMPRRLAPPAVRSHADDAGLGRVRGLTSIWWRSATARNGAAFGPGDRCRCRARRRRSAPAIGVRCWRTLGPAGAAESRGVRLCRLPPRRGHAQPFAGRSAAMCVGGPTGSWFRPGGAVGSDSCPQQSAARSNIWTRGAPKWPRRFCWASANRSRWDRTENFMATGTIHLLVIAGLHLGILAGAMFWVVRRTPLPHGCGHPAGCGGDPVLYVPGRCRAAGRAGDRCWCWWPVPRLRWGESRLSFNSLAAAALVVLAMNPNNLFHTGAQLSFLSVAGLMWFGPHWMGTSHKARWNG